MIHADTNQIKYKIIPRFSWLCLFLIRPPYVPPEGLEKRQDLSNVKSDRLTPVQAEAGPDVRHLLSLLSSFSFEFGNHVLRSEPFVLSL